MEQMAAGTSVTLRMALQSSGDTRVAPPCGGRQEVAVSPVDSTVSAEKRNENNVCFFLKNAHLDVSSNQVGRLLIRLQGHVDGGEGPTGHLLHLSEQLLRTGTGGEEEQEVSQGQPRSATSARTRLSTVQSAPPGGGKAGGGGR